MLTLEKQIQIIEKAKQQKNTTLKLLANANIMYKKDRETYKIIIETATLKGSLAIYNSLDTAARDKFIEILTNKGDS